MDTAIVMNHPGIALLLAAAVLCGVWTLAGLSVKLIDLQSQRKKATR